MLLPSLSMVFDGSVPLVKRCDGFDGSLWSRSLLPVFLSRSDLLNCRQQFHQHYTFCHDYWYTTKEVQQDERGKRKRSRKGMRIEDWQQQPTPPASSCPPNYCASLEQSTHPHPAKRSSHTCDQKSNMIATLTNLYICSYWLCIRNRTCTYFYRNNHYKESVHWAFSSLSTFINGMILATTRCFFLLFRPKND